MLILKSILFYIILIIILYVVGQLVRYILKMKTDSIIKSIVDGFCAILAIFQVIAYPIQVRNGSFRMLVIIFTLTILFVVISGLIVIIKEKWTFAVDKSFLEIKGILILLVVIQAVGRAWLYHDDDDDAYFVALSSSMIETNIVSSDMEYSTTGLESNMPDGRPDTATWEALIAVCAFIFYIHPAILTHTILPLLLIPIAYMCIYYVAKNLFYNDAESKKKALWFCVFFCILNIFAGYAVYSTGCFLLLRIWQGKAVLVNILFPALLANCLYIMNDNYNKKYFIWNAVILIAGVCTTVIGVYLLPIYYLIIGIPYLLTTDWKISKKLLFPATFSLFPILIYASMALITILTQNAEYMDASYPVWGELFKRNVLQGYYWILFLISIIYIIFRGKRIHKVFFVGSSICLFLTFLNPLFCSIVSQKITGVDVYWRLYWIVPVYYGICYFGVEIISLFKQRFLKYIWITILIVAIGKSGYFMYQAPYFYRHTNIYKLPNEIISIADYILEDSEEIPCVLFPEELAAKARQYTVRLNLVLARQLYQGDNIIEGTDETIGDFYRYFYNQNEYSIEYILDRIMDMKVDYVVRRNDDVILDSEQMYLKTIIDGYQIYYIDVQEKER